MFCLDNVVHRPGGLFGIRVTFWQPGHRFEVEGGFFLTFVPDS